MTYPNFSGVCILHYIFPIFAFLLMCLHRFSLALVEIDQLYAKTPDQPQKRPASISDVYVHGVVDPSTVCKVMLRVSDYVLGLFGLCLIG